MRLIDDDGVVPAQRSIALQFIEQNAVGHYFDEGAVTHFVGETDRVAHGGTHPGFELFGNSFCNRSGCYPAGLSMSNETVYAAPQFQADLR